MVMNIQPLATTATTTQQVEAALNQQLARLALASAGGMFARAAVPPETAQDVQQRLVTRYPLAPTILFAVVLFVYGLIALAIFWASALDSSYAVRIPGDLSGSPPRFVSMSELLSLRLADPLSVVSSLYPPRDETKAAAGGGEGVDPIVAISTQTATLDMFPEGTPRTAREGLYVGLGRSERMGRPAFGIWRWAHMHHYTDW